MRVATLVTLWIVRIAGIAQLVLGTFFWLGRSVHLIPVHISIGFLVVLGLWTIAILALFARAGRGLAIVALFWGVALPALGLPQATILVGSSHWIIRVIHLLMGLIALGLADRLAARILVPRRKVDGRLEAAA